MSKDYQFKHKCRRCGEIDLGGVCGEAMAFDTLRSVLNGERLAIIMASRMVEIHRCHDGGFGVADLIGCRVLSS